MRSVSEAGGRVGLLFAFGTAGNVVGAVAAGLWLLPALGVRGLLTAGMLANLSLAAAFLLREDGRHTRTGLLISALALGAVFMPGWEPLAFSFGANRMEIPKGLDYQAFLRTVARFKLHWIKDGREATVAVIESPTSGISLMVNGKADASTRNDMRTQSLLAHVPLILRPEAKNVVLIGLGSGVTAGAALLHPIERLDVFEISLEVRSANRFFREFDHHALDDPRLRLDIGDGRAELARSKFRYDVIISEPSNPWMAGVGNLFTSEFYELAKSKLTGDGLMLQWFHLYEMDDDTLRLVLRTFTKSFPAVSIWYTHSMDILLVGGASEAALESMRARFDRPQVKEDLARIGITEWTTFLSLQMTGPGGGRRLGGEGEINSDRRPRLEYAAPKAFFLRRAARLPFSSEDRLEGPPEGMLLEAELRRRKRGLASREYAEIAAYHEGRRGPFRDLMVSRWRADHPRDAEARLAEARQRLEEGELLHARKLLTEWLKIRPEDDAARGMAAGVESKILLGEARERAARGDLRAAFRLIERAAVLAEKSPTERPDEVWMAAASMAMKLDDSGAVLTALEKALAINPENEEARSLVEFLMKANAD